MVVGLFFSSRRRHTRWTGDWSSDVCSSDLILRLHRRICGASDSVRPQRFAQGMKTILVLSSHPDFAEAIRTSLNAEQFRVVHRHTVDEGEPLLVHNLIAACVLDADLMGVECVWIIERLRR